MESSRARIISLGIAGQIRLLSILALLIYLGILFFYEALIELQIPKDITNEVLQELEEETTIIIALQNEPSHIPIVLSWLQTTYPYSSYLILDFDSNIIVQSQPPPSIDVLEEMWYPDWESSIVLPFTDNNGKRFYTMIVHDFPYESPTYLDIIESTIPFSVILIFLLSTMILARIIVKPIQQVAHTVNQIAAGNLHQRTGVSRQDEIGDLARAFDVMAENNQQLLLAQKHLIAQVGHELRTPLARVQVAIDILQERMALHEQEQMMEVRNDIEEMSRMISDILVVSRLETASLSGMITETLRLEEFDVESWALAVIQRFGVMFPERPLTPSFVDLGFFVGDRMLLGRVLWNLLENAHKYSSIEKTVWLQISMHNDQLLIEVKDEGEGIPQERLDGVFEPFFQGRSSETSTMKGFGLGLSLCKQVALAHSGTIELKNRTVKGLIAQVMLPISSTNEGQSD